MQTPPAGASEYCGGQPGHRALPGTRGSVCPSEVPRPGWTAWGDRAAARGASGAGLSESPPPAPLFALETCSRLPLLCKAPALPAPPPPLRGSAVAARGQRYRPPGTVAGRAAGTPQPGGRFPRRGGRGAGRSRRGGRSGRGPSPCHTSLEPSWVGGHVTGSPHPSRPPGWGVLGRPSREVRAPAASAHAARLHPVPHPDTLFNCAVLSLQMKDLGAEFLAGREGVQLFGLLSLYLEQEQRFQPREKGLSLIEATPEVSHSEKRTFPSRGL